MDMIKKEGHKAPTNAGNGKAAPLASTPPAATSSPPETAPVVITPPAAASSPVKATPVASTTEPEQLCVIDADGVQTCSDVISVEAVEEPSIDYCELERPRRRRRPAPEEEGFSTPILIGGGLLLAYLLFSGSSGRIAGSESAAPSPDPDIEPEEGTGDDSAEIAGNRNRFITKRYGPGPLRSYRS